MLPMLSDPKYVVTVLCPTDAAFKVLNKEVGLTYEEMLAHPSYAKQVCSFCGRFYRWPWTQILGRMFQAFSLGVGPLDLIFFRLDSCIR